MSAPPRAPAPRKTFGEYVHSNYMAVFLATEVGNDELPGAQEMLNRIRIGTQNGRIVADDIDRLDKLQTWARERWPTWYTRRSEDEFGKNTGPTGKQALAEIWADYLAWAEADES